MSMRTAIEPLVARLVRRTVWLMALLMALSAGMLVPTHGVSQESVSGEQDTFRQAIQLKVRGLDVSQALTHLGRTGLVDPAAVAGILIAADYPPQAVEAELMGAFNLRRDRAVAHVRSALSEQGRLAGTAVLRRSLCYTARGALMQCPLPGADEPRTSDAALDRLEHRLRLLESAADDTALRLSLRLTTVPFAHEAGNASTLGGRPAEAFAVAGSGASSEHVPCAFEMRLRRELERFPVSPTCMQVQRLDTEAKSQDAVMVMTATGRPVIAYSHNGVEIVFCADPQCATHSIQKLSLDAARWVSLVLPPDGLPVVSYFALASESLRVAKCLSSDCSEVSVRVVDDEGRSGEHSVIAIGSDGLPFIAYHQHLNGARLRVAHCHDASCVKTTNTTHFVAPGTGTWLSMVIGSDGNPFVVFRNPSQERLMALHCATARCLQGEVREVAHQAGFETAVALGANGFPIVVHWGMAAGSSMESLRLVRCHDVGCVSKSGVGIAAGVSNQFLNTRGRGPSITIGNGGLPMVSYSSGDGGLELWHCHDPECAQRSRVRLAHVPAGTHSSFLHLDSSAIGIGADGVLTVSASWGRGITVVRCPYC